MDVQLRYLELVLKRKIARQRLHNLTVHADNAWKKFKQLLDSNLEFEDADKFVEETFSWSETLREKSKMELAVQRYSTQLEELMRSVQETRQEHDDDSDPDEFLSSRDTDPDYFLHHL